MNPNPPKGGELLVSLTAFVKQFSGRMPFRHSHECTAYWLKSQQQCPKGKNTVFIVFMMRILQNYSSVFMQKNAKIFYWNLSMTFHSNRLTTFVLSSAVVFSCVCTDAFAQPIVTENNNTVTLVIESDGRTTVTNELDITVENKQLTALTVENMALNPTWDTAVADLPDGKTRIPLKVLKLEGRKYELEASPKIPIGNARLTFTYTGNLISDKYLGKTTSEENGDLYFFHWAPMQWASEMDYREVRIVFPMVVAGPQISDAEFYQIAGYNRSDGFDAGNNSVAKILTEKDLNKRNKIDYFGTQINGRYLLTMRVYQERVKAEEAQNIQFYMRRDFITFDENAVQQMDSSDNPFNMTGLPVGIGVWILLAVGGLGGGAVLLGSKRHERESHKEPVKTAAEELWEEPELQVGGFGKQGKILKDLHPIEVGLLLGLEIQQIVGIMVQALGDQNKLIVRSLEPIKAYPASDVSLEPIEQDFVGIFDELGNIDNTKLQDFLEKVIAGFQEKSWDCDMDATRQYYRAVMYDNPDEPEVDKLQFKVVEERDYTNINAPCPSGYDDYYWRNRYYWRHYNGYYTNRYHYQHGLPAQYSVGYAAFMQSSTCFHGCFTQPNLENVCHSACHSACHDACHSACHSACHHACHSACHSACVSGGAR